jgi:hypothetical protein
MARIPGWTSTLLALGSAAFAAGTYFSRPEPAAPAPVAAPVTVAAPAPRPAPRRVTPELRRAGAEHARAALAAWHPRFVADCWEPSVAARPEPRQIPLRFNLSFDAGGKLIGVGISPSRSAYRPDVTACLRKLGVQLAIPAPGLPLQVEVPLVLP